MLFESQLLEQATDERIGRYKADRFRHAPRIIDYCCGLGGDLLNLLTVASSVTGVDQSPLACKLARFNCQANQRGVEIEQRAVDPASFKCDSWFHIDPDRRATGSRTVNLDRYEPNMSDIEQLVQTCRTGAIKLAPATRIPQTWRARVERQWIGGRRDCKQQVVWWATPPIATAITRLWPLTTGGTPCLKLKGSQIRPLRHPSVTRRHRCGHQTSSGSGSPAASSK